MSNESKERKVYRAVMAQQTTLVNAAGSNIKVVSYVVPIAEKINLSRHVAMFGYMNPVMKKYQIYEEQSGMMIGEGRTKEDAKVDVARFLREANEAMFFKQAEQMGRAIAHPAITFEEAMQSFQELVRIKPSLLR